MSDHICPTCNTLLRVCASCKKEFPVGIGGRRAVQAYCSKSCARRGDWKNMTLAERRGFSISRAKRGPLGARIKTRSRVTGRFYFKVRTENGWEYEHRVVMEKIIGRKLTKDEVVHHKDENGLNNKEENLELMARDAHTRKHHLGFKNPRKAPK